MAGISLAQRDLAETRTRLADWFTDRFGGAVSVSELQTANRTSGWSSESLVFRAERDGATADYVIRIPPAGGGMFAEYDLAGQTRTQELLHGYGIATPSPIHYEADLAWIGSPFMVMPRIVGHIPSDTTYASRGWLHDAGPAVQRRLHDGFLGTLAALQRVPVAEAPWLRRAQGDGTTGELAWWRDYLDWAADNDAPDLMVRAFGWLERNQPAEPGPPAISWGDARLSNTICDDSGTIVGVLDWEQACICPAEADFGWWLATRRQMLEVQGLQADPELPGFDTRERVIRRYEEMIGRPLRDLGWYEMFSMVRMGCCIQRMHVLLRRLGQTDHGFMRAPLLPAWVVDAISVQ
ncbi:MAG: phosphotransferase family protein [Mycobacterium sp.]